MGATSSVYEIVKKVMDLRNIPEYIWGPIMEAESEGNPQAHNQKGENSWGLFQINTDANPQFSTLDLLDPQVNAEVAATYFIAPAYEKVKDVEDPAFQTEYVWREGIRPLWSESQSVKIQGLFDKWFGGSLDVDESADSGRTSGGRTGTGEPPEDDNTPAWLKHIQGWVEGSIVKPLMYGTVLVALIGVAVFLAYMVFRPEGSSVADTVKKAAKAAM